MPNVPESVGFPKCVMFPQVSVAYNLHTPDF